ncbi:MAG: hypothetical protein U9P50_01740 [Patescibacteria group bacterium]|nr:hypothetical protein [Patescibacteria group bacterium]
MKKLKWERNLKKLLIKQGALISESDESGQQIYEEQKQFISTLQAKTRKEVCERMRMKKRKIDTYEKASKAWKDSDEIDIIQGSSENEGFNQAVDILNKILDEIIKESEGK